MKTLSLNTRLVLLLAAIICVYGLLVPLMISLKYPVFVLTGMALALYTPIFIYTAFRAMTDIQKEAPNE